MKKMQCKKLLLCCGISMLALFGLYGCSAKEGNNADGANKNESSVSDTNTGTGNTTAANGTTDNANTNTENTTGGTTGNGNTDGATSNTGNEKVEKSLQSEYTIGNIKELEKFEIDHEAGNVTIGVSTDENISIKADSNITAYSQEELEHIAENIDIINNVVDNKCILRVVNKTEGVELWDWLENERKEKDVSIDLEILLPKNFVSIDVSADDGTIRLSGVEGTMDLETDIGDINVDLVENFSKGSIMEVETDNGNIEINLKNNPVEYTRNEKNNVKARVNGVCDLEATTDNGSVVITE